MRLCTRNHRAHILPSRLPRPQGEGLCLWEAAQGGPRGLRSQHHSATTGLHGITLVQTQSPFPDLKTARGRAGFRAVPRLPCSVCRRPAQRQREPGI